MRELILNHWHCILPVIGIIAAMIFISDKSQNIKQNKSDRKPQKGENKHGIQ